MCGEGSADLVACRWSYLGAPMYLASGVSTQTWGGGPGGRGLPLGYIMDEVHASSCVEQSQNFSAGPFPGGQRGWGDMGNLLAGRRE